MYTVQAALDILDQRVSKVLKVQTVLQVQQVLPVYEIRWSGDESQDKLDVQVCISRHTHLLLDWAVTRPISDQRCVRLSENSPILDSQVRPYTSHWTVEEVDAEDVVRSDVEETIVDRSGSIGFPYRSLSVCWWLTTVLERIDNDARFITSYWNRYTWRRIRDSRRTFTEYIHWSDLPNPPLLFGPKRPSDFF